MKSKVLQRPMFMSPDEVENVGIMQGFMDDMEDIFEEEDESSDEDYETGKMMGRTPDSPEIIMNNLRGDMRSVDARVEELAEMVGYRAAAETPMEVLALLQPVLAGQGAGQGIASLPMGAAGQAMPPMPPVPAAPQMQPAGAPPAMPAGGIASLPQGQSAPMAMAKGGLVQYFQAGSDEGAVTQIPDQSSSETVSSRLKRAGEDEILKLLAQKPMAVPSLQFAMEERIPTYQSLMGASDKDAMRAAMLFDIAQTALGYAGNVGPQGQPLRGSQAARLAAATSALPGQIGARLTAQQQQDQAVRLAALQAAEKDIQSIREANLDLTKEQRSLMSSLARTPTGTGTSSVFGSGMEGRARAFVTENAALYATGQLTPEEKRQFEMSISIISQPRTEVDAFGRTVRITPSLPEFLQDALAAGGYTPTTTGAAGAPAVITGETPAVTAGETPAPSATDSSAAGQVGFSVLERSPLSANPVADSYYQAGMPTFFNAAKAQGPLPALKSFVFRTPILNALSTTDAANATTGRQFLEAMKSALPVAFQAGTDRFTNDERNQLLADLGVGAKVIDTPEAFVARLFALDDSLQRMQAAAMARYNNRELSDEDLRLASTRLANIHEVRALIGAPLHLNGVEDPRAREIALSAPVGTPLYVVDSNGVRATTVTQEFKDRFSR